MKKYKEIMDQVTVTPEMEERIIKRLQESAPARPPRRFPLYRKLLPAAACLLLLAAAASVLPHPVHDADNQAAEENLLRSTDANLLSRSAAADSAPTASSPAAFAERVPEAAAAKEDAATAAVEDAADMAAEEEAAGMIAAEEAADMAAEIQNAEALSSQAGFSIRDLAGLPFQPTGQTYAILQDGTAQITYTAENQTLIYSRKQEAQSGGSENICSDPPEASEEPGLPEKHVSVEEKIAPEERKSPEEQESSEKRKSSEEQESPEEYSCPDENMTPEALTRSRIDLNGLTVTLCGSDGTFFQAHWTEGGYTDSIRISGGLSQEEMLSLVQNAR